METGNVRGQKVYKKRWEGLDTHVIHTLPWLCIGLFGGVGD